MVLEMRDAIPKVVQLVCKWYEGHTTDSIAFQDEMTVQLQKALMASFDTERH